MPGLASISIDLDGLPHYAALHGLPPEVVTAQTRALVHQVAVPRFAELVEGAGGRGTLFVIGLFWIRARLGLDVSIGSWITEERLRMLAAGLLPHASSLDEAQARSLGLLQLQVRKQAATLSYVDGFVLLEWSVVLFLILAAFLKPFAANYRLLSKAD